MPCCNFESQTANCKVKLFCHVNACCLKDYVQPGQIPEYDPKLCNLLEELTDRPAIAEQTRQDCWRILTVRGTLPPARASAHRVLTLAAAILTGPSSTWDRTPAGLRKPPHSFHSSGDSSWSHCLKYRASRLTARGTNPKQSGSLA